MLRRKIYNLLDFEEFCSTNGVNIIDYLKNCLAKIKNVGLYLHNQFLDLFKQYIIVGGMPVVVNNFISNRDFVEVLSIQREILDNYKNDIVKYALDGNTAKIRTCFLSIPNQLAGENKKSKYNLVDKRGTTDKYFGSLEWLHDAGIINFCYNLKNPESSLEENKNVDCFKVYMRDTGLLVAILEGGSQLEILRDNLGIYKGAIYENVVADILHKSRKKLYYFEYNSTLEIAFFIRYNNIITEVEVKSADNTKSKSLNSIMMNWSAKQGIKLSSKNIEIKDNNVTSLPLYMAMFL